MKNWPNTLFYFFNALTAIFFAFLIIYPIINFIQLEFKGVPRKSLDWNDYAILLIWYGYAIFCLRKLIRYLRHPDPDQHAFFILLLLGLLPVGFVLFMLAMAGFGFVGAQ